MKRYSSATVLVVLLTTAMPVRSEEPVPSVSEMLRTPTELAPKPSPNSFSAILLQDPFSTIKGGSADAAEPPKPPARFTPAHIRDNAFLVEEAYNQEAGVVQHVFNWIFQLDRNPGGRTRDFAYSYTMEIPLGSQKHQFSFTPQFFTSMERPSGGQPVQQGDVGDTFLSYRYQLLSDDDFLWMAPRATLIVPTGDKRLGTGTGKVGYQFNLPVSKYGEMFDFHFNAGATYTPGVSIPLAEEVALLGTGSSRGVDFSSPPRDLVGYNLGGSAFWKPRTYLNFFVEVLALWNDEIDERGQRARTTQVLVNPGFRYAVCQLDGVEWVLGLSAPIGLTRDTPDIGIFAYMSVEHIFLKKPGGGK